MRKSALLMAAAMLIAACGTNGTAEPRQTTNPAPAPTDAPATTASSGISTRADVVEYCGIEDHSFDADPSDPEAVEAGWSARLAVSQRQMELAPPEIEEEIALVHESLVDFVAALEEAGWDYETLPQDAGEIPQQAEAAVIEFNVENCGVPDPRCNPDDTQYCTEEQLAEFEG